MSADDLPLSVEFHAGRLLLLDQTRLPHEVVVDAFDEAAAVADAIRRLVVRGAPAIGIAAAYGCVLGVTPTPAGAALFERNASLLRTARPTAVNLAWAVDRMRRVAATTPLSQLPGVLLAEAQAIHAQDRSACRAIGEFGQALVEQAPNVLTHCNAGALAVSELGTALAPIYCAAAAGVPVHVYVDETRPLLQGARLTAFELTRKGIPVTLITDSMAAAVLQQGKVDIVIVGADRVAANGDTANKIGKLGVAVLCAHFAVPFYVACPTSTIDLHTPTGAGIPIEERAPDEVRRVGTQQVSESTVSVFNPAFDVTPAPLIKGFITERGILQPADFAP